MRRLAPWAGERSAPTEPDETAGVPPRINMPFLRQDQVDDGTDDFADLPTLLKPDAGHSQVSQGTDPVASGDQETIPDGLPRRLLVGRTASSVPSGTNSRHARAGLALVI